MPYTLRIGAGSESQKTYPVVSQTEFCLGALWRYVAQGVVPQGAVLRDEDRAHFLRPVLLRKGIAGRDDLQPEEQALSKQLGFVDT